MLIALLKRMMGEFKNWLLSVGIAFLGAPVAYGLEANLFQLSHKLEEESRVFLMNDGKTVVRLMTELRAVDLKSRGSGIEPIASVEILLNAKGSIEFFAIHRFNDSKVFEVRKDEKSMKFVKKEAESALFNGSMASYRGNKMKTKEALTFLFENGDSSIQKDNLKILKTLKIPSAQDFVAVEFMANRDDFLDLLDADITAGKSQESKTLERATPSSKPVVAEEITSEAVVVAPAQEDSAAEIETTSSTVGEKSSVSMEPSDFDEGAIQAPAIESAEADSKSIN